MAPDQAFAADNLGEQGPSSISEAVSHPDVTTIQQHIVGDVVSSGRENGKKSRKPRISETIILNWESNRSPLNEMHIHQQNHWNDILFYWYQSYHWYQWTIEIDESYQFVYIGHDCNLAKVELFTLVEAYSLLILFDLRFLKWSLVSNLVRV